MGNQLVISYFTENGVHGGGLWLVGSILFFNNYFKAKMQNSPSKFHHFSFQSSKFKFCHFNLLNFIHPQLSPPLTIC